MTTTQGRVPRARRRDERRPQDEPALPWFSWTDEAAVLASLAVPAVVVLQDMPVPQLDALFRRDPTLGRVVVHTTHGPSLIDRRWFQERLVGPRGYGRALSHRRRVDWLQPPACLILDAATALEVAATAISAHQAREPLEAVVLVMADGSVSTVSISDVFRALAQRYAQRAVHDALTGLPTRTFLDRHLDPAGAHPVEAAFSVDLDRFTDVNDRHGRAAGDQVLVTFAHRLRACVRQDDLVLRLAGDRFVVMAGTVPSARASRSVAERMLLAAALPFAVRSTSGEAMVSLAASVGYARLDVDDRAGSDLTTLLGRAEEALREAKARGRGRVWDHADIDAAGQRSRHSTTRRHELERRLGTALRAGALRMDYQPMATLATGRVVAAEALARWDDAELGEVSPDEFVDVAEESGLVLDLGRWALMTACRDTAGWPVIPGRFPVGVSVNVSARQVEQPSFVEEVCTMITASGLDPRRLTLELTETSAISDLDQAARRLQQLRNLGIGIALDDYGTGYSTLAMLRRLPLTVVKIDQWFVDQLADGAIDSTLIELVIETAHHLGLTVCAEGIEHPDQVTRLAAMGCDIGQGWHYARPLPGSQAFVNWLSTSG